MISRETGSSAISRNVLVFLVLNRCLRPRLSRFSSRRYVRRGVLILIGRDQECWVHSWDLWLSQLRNNLLVRYILHRGFRFCATSARVGESGFTWLPATSTILLVFLWAKCRDLGVADDNSAMFKIKYDSILDHEWSTNHAVVSIQVYLVEVYLI